MAELYYSFRVRWMLVYFW